MTPPPVILQVEDRDEDVFLLRRAFARAEVAVTVNVARDGREAIDYLAGTGRFGDREQYPFPTLVLLDLKLPARTGLEVLGWIRAQPSTRTLIVIILSSSIDAGDVQRAYEIGVNAFLVKPSDIHALTDMCKALSLFWLTHNQAPPTPPRRG